MDPKELNDNYVQFTENDWISVETCEMCKTLVDSRDTVLTHIGQCCERCTQRIEGIQTEHDKSSWIFKE